MIKNVVCGMGLAITLYASASISDLLLHDLVTIADAYYDLGIDNNYLDMKLMPADDFKERYSMSAMSLQYSKIKELATAIKQCVFMAKGAYGEHMDEELQERVSHTYAKTIYQMAQDSSTAINIITTTDDSLNMGTGIFNAPCVFGVEYGDQILLMQGAGMD